MENLEGLRLVAFGDYYRGKKVLVTGHTGFKGSWLTQWLVDLGAEVAGFSVDLPSEPSHFQVLGLAKSIRDFRGDIRDPAALRRAMDEFQPEIVFHLAAQALVRESYEHPADTFHVNVVGTAHVLDAVRQTRSVRVSLVITSDKVYENHEWEYGYRENDRLGGKDPYSASKAATEIVFSSWFRSFFNQPGAARIASVRAGNVIGGGDWAKDRLVPDAVRAWSRNQELLVRNPKSTRPWQHVLEALGGYLWLAARLGMGDESRGALNGEAFNFGPNNEAHQTVETLIGEMKKTWSQAGWCLDPAGVGQMKEAMLLKVCCEKAQWRLGWNATLSFEEAVQMTASWYQAYYENSASSEALTSLQIRDYVKRAQMRKMIWADSIHKV
ncbi:CDP-glucose 4,6-dehydratase [Bdellovibrionota bacterium FG-1]